MNVAMPVVGDTVCAVVVTDAAVVTARRAALR
jgi:hypothetical protein